jgi:hypothetical protein
VITSAAQINDAVISNAKIQNAAITTAKIGANQVTFPQFMEGPAQSDYANPGLEQTLVSITIDQTGAPAWIFAESVITHSDGVSVIGTSSAQFEYVLKRNGNIISGTTGLLVGGSNTPSFILDTTSTFTGNVTYSLHIRGLAGPASFLRVLQPSIFVIELKR